mgnify:CR=1 FL=1
MYWKVFHLSISKSRVQAVGITGMPIIPSFLTHILDCIVISAVWEINFASNYAPYPTNVLLSRMIFSLVSSSLIGFFIRRSFLGLLYNFCMCWHHWTIRPSSAGIIELPRMTSSLIPILKCRQISCLRGLLSAI